MSRHVAIVTDSTAYLPRRTMERHGIIAVPLTVVLGDQALEEGTEISARSLALALQKRHSVTTSRPSPEVFAATYRAVADSRRHRRDLPPPVGRALRDVRRRAAGGEGRTRARACRRYGHGGHGPGVLRARCRRGRGSGGGPEEAVAAAEKRAADTSAYFYVDTLDYLRRGGRIGAAQALLGSALAVKPLLRLDGGRIELLEKVRTASRAIARLEEIVAQQAGSGAVDIAVHHLAAPEGAERLAERLRGRVPGLVELYVSEVGAVIGAHTGPGLLGAVVSPR